MTAFSKITKRMLEKMPPTTTKPILNTEPPIRIPSIELHGFKRVMSSPIVVNTTSEISTTAIFPRTEKNQINGTNLNNTTNSLEVQSIESNISSLVIFGFVAIILLAIAMLVSTVAICLRARKKAANAKRQREEEEAEEVAKMRLSGLRYHRVELKNLGGVMRPERAV
ncbi:hypothetical protein ONS95_006840 [Cadophora gregata]|uniref:uncharacterized protein n=1 Tax=Cadophora gregata TaxID=51156 RepID=UPI0026DDAAA9|nr:uncharacterized protein ONS95_006840 [Cadophora gregata]KAK0101683.1 hypothetical protein ONS95_006840 [Cadophora gregata]